MDKHSAKDYLPLVQALADGKVIQHLTFGGWKDADNLTFTSQPKLYRIKPEPRVLYTLLRPDGTRWGWTFDKREAELWEEFYDGHDGVIRKFIEVVED